MQASAKKANYIKRIEQALKQNLEKRKKFQNKLKRKKNK